MGKFDSILNIGIPIDTDVQLDLEFVYELCKGNDKARKSISDSVKDINRYLYETCGVYTSSIMPFFVFTIFVDPLTLKKDFHFTSLNIVQSMLLLLNEKEKRQALINGDIDTELVLNKLTSLDKIDNENDLRKNFPKLFEIYSKEKEVASILKKASIVLNEMKDFQKILAFRKELIDECQKDGVEKNIDEEIEKANSFSVNSFCSQCANVICKAFKHIEEIELHLEATKIKMNFFTREMKDQLLLYILYRYIEHMESNYIPDEVRQKCLYFVNSCFKSINQNTFANLKLDLPLYKNPITLKGLYNRYKQILVDHPELKIVDFSDVNFENMTKEEIENFINEFLSELRAKWELIPKGTNIFKNNIPVNTKRGKKSKKSEEEKQKEYEHLVNKYIEKKEFYGSLDPMFVIQGINKFDGYFACVFSNGMVVLDKYYDNAKTGRVSKGDAAYIMTLDQFYVLSHYDRSYLSGNRLCKRVYHTKGWQETILEYINTSMPNINTPLEMKKLFLSNDIVEPKRS